MKTQIFKSYSDFLDREDKEINGVNEDFAKNNTNYEKQNESNKGCFHCSGCFDCSGCSDCSGKNEEMVIPKIKNIHQKIFAAVQNPGALEMGSWHTCETTHCRAGWVVHLAGYKGKALELKTSTLFAAMQIYKESSPIKVSPVRFYDGNKQAMEDIEKFAKEEAK